MPWLENNKFELSKSRTSMLWLNYTQYISIVQQFIWAEWASGWKLHVEITKHMLKLSAATGHNNYAKTCWLYLQSAKWLEKDHPHIFEQFMLGNHTVRWTEKNWSGISTDLSIKQILMKSLKGHGGKSWSRHALSHVLKALKDNSIKNLFKATSQSNVSVR